MRRDTFVESKNETSCNKFKWQNENERKKTDDAEYALSNVVSFGCQYSLFALWVRYTVVTM